MSVWRRLNGKFNMKTRSLIAFAVGLALAAIGHAQAPAPAGLTPPRPPVAPPTTPLSVDAPKQVSVTVKVVEFQATKGVETGLSAFRIDLSWSPASACDASVVQTVRAGRLPPGTLAEAFDRSLA